MLHHIFRNLWNSRKRNVWILLELIVIAIVCWMVIDPLFVIFYNKSIPDGYEADGLYRLQLSDAPSGTSSASGRFLWFLLMKKFARKISGN